MFIDSKLKLLFMSLLLVSCNSLLEETNFSDMDGVSKIHVVCESFDDRDSSFTRAIPTYNGSTYNSLFFNTDTLGIFSFNASGEQQSYQLTFPLNEIPDGGSSSFTFDGGGWYMSVNNQYQAYAPYNYSNKDARKIPLNFIGQKQKGKNNMDMLGPYYFVTSVKGFPDAATHELHLSMSFKIAVTRIQIQMPATASYKKLYLVTDGDFALKSTYDLETGSFGDNLMPCNAMCLNLEDVNAIAGEQIMFFMCVKPVDLTDKKIEVVLVDESNRKYVANYTGKKVFVSAFAKGILSTAFDTSNPNNAYGFVLDNTYVLPDVPEGEDGISGTAPDFVPVGGTTNSCD